MSFSPENRTKWRKPLTKTQLKAIKLKLGLRPLDPLPKCPTKSQTKLTQLELNGDFSHSDYHPPENWDGFTKFQLQKRFRKKKTGGIHPPCHICGCTRTAGWGTKHYGWGLCCSHERGRGYRGDKHEIADRHLLALQQRHPYFYWEMDKVKDSIARRGKQAEGKFDLTLQVKNVAGILDAFYKTVSERDSSPDMDHEIVGAIKDLTAALKEQGGQIESDQALDIHRALCSIENRLVCGLTEVTQNGLVPMSDKTRISLVATTIPKLTKASKDLFDMLKERWITDDHFDIWYAGLLRTVDRKFGDATFIEDGEKTRIMDAMAECFRDAGDPRRGT